MTTPAGWYPDPAGAYTQRYFDGVQWTDSYAPVVQHVQHGQIVTVSTNHGLHAVLTLLTCGAWLPIWIIIAIMESRRVTVQRY
jgi:hypothetical protein